MGGVGCGWAVAVAALRLVLSSTEEAVMKWDVLLLLGAYHGINPGMGWLFAVALGMQQGSVRGVLRALPPIAIGHGLSIAAVLGVAVVARIVLPLDVVRVATAILLVTFGSYRVWRHHHPRFGGMRVGFRDLTIWSFLMATAHGAGLMLLPWVMPMPAEVTASTVAHASHAMSSEASFPWTGALVLGVHTAAYLVVMTAVAWIVYRKVGLAVLRTAWFNLDWAWAGALVGTGLVIFLM
jgi:hypothetical protein